MDYMFLFGLNVESVKFEDRNLIWHMLEEWLKWLCDKFDEQQEQMMKSLCFLSPLFRHDWTVSTVGNLL